MGRRPDTKPTREKKLFDNQKTKTLENREKKIRSRARETGRFALENRKF